MKTVFLFVDKDLLIRDLLTGDFLPYLATKFRVVVFMHPKSYSRNKNFLVEGKNIEYEIWPCYNDRVLNQMKALRTVFIRQFDYLNVQQYKKAHLPPTPLNKVLMPLAKLGQSVFNLNFFSYLEKLLLSRESKQVFRSYAETHKPALLATASCGIMNFEAEGLLLAQTCNLPTVAVNFNWDNLTSKVRSLRLPDNLIVWNDRIREVAMAVHGYKDNNVFVSGIMRFDPYFQESRCIPDRESFLQNKGLNPKNKTIVYASTADFIYPYQKNLIKTLIDFRRERKFVFGTNIFVRLHYKDSMQNYREFSGEPDICIEEYKSTTLPADTLNLKATLIYGDVHINYASTISLDACALDRPIINLAFPQEAVDRFPNQEFPHYRPLPEAGAVRLVHSCDELVGAINSYYLDQKQDSEARKIIRDTLIGPSDGLAYRRAVEAIETIVHRSC